LVDASQTQAAEDEDSPDLDAKARVRAMSSLSQKLTRVRALTSAHYGKSAQRSQVIVVRGLRCSNLLFLSRLSAPKPYLELELNGVVVHTTSVVSNGSKSVAAATNPDWTDAGDVEITAHQELLGDHLHVKLFYQGAIFGEDQVGVATVPLANLDFEPLDHAVFPISYAPTERGKRAAQLAEKERRVLPSVTLSAFLKDDV